MKTRASAQSVPGNLERARAALPVAILHHHAQAPRAPHGCYCRVMAALPPRSTYFWILPVAVLGSSATIVKV